MPGLHLYADIPEYRGVEVRDSGNLCMKNALELSGRKTEPPLFYRKGADLKSENSKTQELYLKNSQNLYLKKKFCRTWKSFIPKSRPHNIINIHTEELK